MATIGCITDNLHDRVRVELACELQMEPQDFQPDLGLPGICSILDGVVCYRRFALLTLKLEELAHVGELLFLAIVHVSEELQVIAFKESICKPSYISQEVKYAVNLSLMFYEIKIVEELNTYEPFKTRLIYTLLLNSLRNSCESYGVARKHS